MGQENIKAYYQLWNELWKLFRTWIKEYQDDDSFWQRVLRESDAFLAEHDNKFAKKVLLDIVEELERQAIGENRKT